MQKNYKLSGVFAACLTPLNSQDRFIPDDLLELLQFLHKRGCHGVLLLGTTGEGPSFSSKERLEIMRTAVEIRKTIPDFILMAGTGTPSLAETIELNRTAFDLGMDGVVVLPPYFYRNATEDGLFAWYSKVIRQSVPANGKVLGYHIPAMSGVALSFNLIERLMDKFSGQFVGIKDSSGDPDHAAMIGKRFGKDLIIFSGNDRLFRHALENFASGCITAPANITSPLLRRLWDTFHSGVLDQDLQDKIEKSREIIERYPPAPPLLKYLIAEMYGFNRWDVRSPLIELPAADEQKVILEARYKLNIPNEFPDRT